ncbi:hypothetical protein B0H11DRAFT_2284491 [Mycena galericulata]|nr:hypothetical protein B0H11DRAFT_2284491 [Mycena galericulata]
MVAQRRGRSSVCDSVPLSSDASFKFRQPHLSSARRSYATHSCRIFPRETRRPQRYVPGVLPSMSWQNIIAGFFTRPRHHDMEALASKMPWWTAFMRLLPWMLNTPRGSSCVPLIENRFGDGPPAVSIPFRCLTCPDSVVPDQE